MFRSTILSVGLAVSVVLLVACGGCPITPPSSSPPPTPKAEEPVVRTRIQKLDEEDLGKQLLNVREISRFGTPQELLGLPIRMGQDCVLGKEPAENLQALSLKLRGILEASIPRGTGDPRPDPDLLRAKLLTDEWRKPEAIPALLQLLQAENKPVRLLLVEVLSKIDHKRATEALAMRALVDLSPEVREAALRALLNRSHEDYQALLLAGLRYPWPVVQQHAAEAIVALHLDSVTTDLVTMLDKPSAMTPFTVKANNKDVTLVYELVRVNHLANCLLCHSQSNSTNDLVRGAVPTLGVALPAPASGAEYYKRGGSFVRADVTYLRQDFSVLQPVANPGVWPAYQRYDYLVQLRSLTPPEVRLWGVGQDSQQEPIRFALRNLTGSDDPKVWQTLLRPVPLKEQTTSRDWSQFLSATIAPSDATKQQVPPPDAPKQRVPPPDETKQQSEAERLRDELVAAPPAKKTAVINRLRDGKGTAYTDALAAAIPRLDGDAFKSAREALAERLSGVTADTLSEKLRDGNAEVRRAAALAVAMKEEKSLVSTVIEMLADPEASVARAAHAALKDFSTTDFGPANNASPQERTRAIADWNAWWAKQQPK